MTSISIELMADMHLKIELIVSRWSVVIAGSLIGLLNHQTANDFDNNYIYVRYVFENRVDNQLTNTMVAEEVMKQLIKRSSNWWKPKKLLVSKCIEILGVSSKPLIDSNNDDTVKTSDVNAQT